MANFRPNQNEYNNMTPFKTWLKYQINTWGLNSFPFVESDFDDLTNYAMMMKLMKHFNVLIENQNMVEEDMTKLYNAFTELQNYLFEEFADYKSELNESFDEYKNQVDGEIEQFETSITGDFNTLHDYVYNYFDNLDVQNEINNKLDEMVEDGTLQEIITDYLNSKAVFAFDSVNDMIQATNLINGSYAKTLGYYTINDGGAGLYKISNSASNLYHQETLTSGLYANLIIENDVISLKQLGGKENDDTYDNHSHYVEYENLCINNDKKYTLLIPSGTWYASETQFKRENGLIIKGMNKAMKGSNTNKDYTTLKNINNQQDYYFKIGDDANSTSLTKLIKGYEIGDLVFEGKYTISALIILGVEWSKVGYLHFRFITSGHCISISTSWEIDFDFMTFRMISSHDSAIYFDKVYTSTEPHPNCSALYFNYLNFENMNCTCIETNKKANFTHNDFNVIQYERSFATSGATNSLPSGVTIDDTFKTYLFKGWFDNTTINSINHYNTTNIYVNDDGTWITYYALFTDDIITTLHEDQAYNNCAISISNILLFGGNATYLVSSHYAERNSIISVGNLTQRDRGEKIYNGDGNTGIILKIGNINNRTINADMYALNCLMDKMIASAKSSQDNNKALELMTTNKALDISGCGLIARNKSPIPCNGVKKINLTLSLLLQSDNSETTGEIRFAYKNRSDSSYTQYTPYFNLTAGINRITIDLSSVNFPEQFSIYAYESSTKKLIIYTINYEY